MCCVGTICFLQINWLHVSLCLSCLSAMYQCLSVSHGESFWCLSNFSGFYLSASKLSGPFFFLFAISIFLFLDSYPNFVSLYWTLLASSPHSYCIHTVLLLKSLSFSLCLHLHTDPQISSQQWLGFTLEITCHSSHSPCLLLSSNVLNISSSAFLPSSLPSLCVIVGEWI